jgi:alpha-N-acetylglucosamine transferase
MKAYISMISTDDFMIGALALYESLQKTNPKYPFYLLITEKVSEECEEKLKKYGINVLRDNDPLIKNITKTGDRWDNTFDKLKIFKLTQFDKVIFLDSDMAIIENLDHLFKRNHFSAVPNREKQEWLGDKKYFSSCILVIKPSLEEYKEIKKYINPTIEQFLNKGEKCGDQNVLNKYYINWPEKNELHISDTYNIFWDLIHDYFFFENYTIMPQNNKIQINAIHFTGAKKPWQSPLIYFIRTIGLPVKNLHRFPSLKVIKFLLSYYKILVSVKQKIKSM